jgi:hypothetical protein
VNRLGALIVAGALSLGLAGPAYADRGGNNDRYDQREGCGEQGGGCNNERHENYEGAGCKYICPTFDKSPVQDSFNFDPQVCLPGATCYFEDRKKGSQGQQPS